MQSTTLRKKIKLELKHSLFRACGCICLFSQLWLFSTLDTASLAQGWETAHGCLNCESPQNLQSCEWFERGWYSMWYAGTWFNVRCNIFQRSYEWIFECSRLSMDRALWNDSCILKCVFCSLNRTGQTSFEPSANACLQLSHRLSQSILRLSFSLYLGCRMEQGLGTFTSRSQVSSKNGESLCIPLVCHRCITGRQFLNKNEKCSSKLSCLLLVA